MEPNTDIIHAQPTDPKDTLTEREQAFVGYYCRYLNAARAAREAGYSARSAKEIGYKNLTKPHILTAISAMMEQHGISAGECIGRLTAWARGTMDPFLTRKGELSLTSTDAIENRHLLKKVRQKKTTRTTPLGEVIEEVQTEIELHDAKDAVDKMLQIHGRYKQMPGDAGGTKGRILIEMGDGVKLSLNG